jgi:hypothetical protein
MSERIVERPDGRYIVRDTGPGKREWTLIAGGVDMIRDGGTATIVERRPASTSARPPRVGPAQGRPNWYLSPRGDSGWKRPPARETVELRPKANPTLTMRFSPLGWRDLRDLASESADGFRDGRVLIR